LLVFVNHILSVDVVGHLSLLTGLIKGTAANVGNKAQP